MSQTAGLVKSGKVTLNDKEFVLGHVFAIEEADFMDASATQLVLVLSDNPIPESQMNWRDWMSWVGDQVEVGSLRALQLTVNAQSLTAENVLLQLEKPGSSVPAEMLRQMAGAQIGLKRLGDGRLEGRLLSSKPFNVGVRAPATFTADLAFVTPVKTLPPVSKTLSAAEMPASPPWKTYQAFLAAAKAADPKKMRAFVHSASLAKFDRYVRIDPEYLKDFQASARRAAQLKPLSMVMRGDLVWVQWQDPKAPGFPSLTHVLSLEQGTWRCIH